MNKINQKKKHINNLSNNQFLKPKWQHILLIVLIGFLVYSNCFKGEFHYDDYRALGNVNINFSLSNLRFVTWLTFFVSSLIGKSNIILYHLVNLFIHIFIGICIYYIVFFTLKKENLHIPFYVSTLFMVHPLATEPVNYFTARFTELATLFCFMTLLFFILFVEKKKEILSNVVDRKHSSCHRIHSF